MFSYEGGLVVALLIWLFSTVMLIVSINSQFERNLNKIGLRLSWVTLESKPLDADDLCRSLVGKVFRFLLVVGIGFPFIFLSWLYVLFAVGFYIYKKSKDAGAPQSVKEFRWRLRNTDLTFDQLVKELMKLNGDDLAEFEEIRAQIISELQERRVYCP